MPSDKLWLIVGDFNLIRRPEDINIVGGDINLMLKFNEAISNLKLMEIPLHGLSFTWSNRQREPLLQRLDWFFISQEWSMVYPETRAKTLPRDISDHVSCLVSFKSKIPKPKIFRFENFWLQFEEFMFIFQSTWIGHQNLTDKAKNLTAKFKITRKVLKEWQQSLPKIDKIVGHIKLLIEFTDIIKEHRDLSIEEWNFRELMQTKVVDLLHIQKTYSLEQNRPKSPTNQRHAKSPNPVHHHHITCLHLHCPFPYHFCLSFLAFWGRHILKNSSSSSTSCQTNHPLTYCKILPLGSG